MLKRGLISLIRFYQRVLSPLKRTPCCRFAPTCSCYAIEAITKRGVLMGFLLTLWRIVRCNPFFPGGYDPVDRPKRLAEPLVSAENGDVANPNRVST